MKAFHKVAAALATLPIAGVIALTGAGIASAATCPAGYHWNDMGNGAGWCAQDASGGGTGGSITYTDAPVAAPVPQAPAMPQPPAYQPPVFAPLPPPPPAPVKPAPVHVKPAPAQNIPAPAPAQVAAPSVGKERNVPAPKSVKGSEVSEIASAHGQEMSEPNKAAAEAHKEEAAVKSTEVKEVDPAAVAPTTSTDSASASPDPSDTPSPVTTLDASQSSDARTMNTTLPAFILGGAMLAAYVAFYAVRTLRPRKTALIKPEVNS